MNKILIILLLCLIGSCTPKNEHNHSEDSKKDHSVSVYYTCSMHPQVREDKPGKCPICLMNLTKVEEENEDGEEVTNSSQELWQCESEPSLTSPTPGPCPLDGTDMVKVHSNKEVIGKIKLRKSQIKHFKPSLFSVTKMKMSKNIRLLGQVLQSEDKESNITARVEGRVEKVFVKSTGSYVQEDDPVIEYYSPKLITGGEEYLLARKSYEKKKSKDFKDLFEQSEKRLILWGVRKWQLEKWYKNNKVPNSITIYSQNAGIVEKKNAFVGKYFKQGQSFFDLTDLSQVWVELDVYEQDSALVRIGQSVSLDFTALPGKKFQGDIDFINPILDSKSRTLKIRTTVDNSQGLLRPGMVAEGNIAVGLKGTPLVIPRTAIIDTGKRKIVWLEGKSSSAFKAHSIKTGFESDGYVEVISGLNEGQNVVIDGNFLLDAQAQLFGGYEDFKNAH